MNSLVLRSGAKMPSIGFGTFVGGKNSADAYKGIWIKITSYKLKLGQTCVGGSTTVLSIIVVTYTFYKIIPKCIEYFHQVFQEHLVILIKNFVKFLQFLNIFQVSLMIKCIILGIILLMDLPNL